MAPELRTQIYTLRTRDTAATSELLYSTDEWVFITLVLETQGSVMVGTKHNIAPVSGTAGVLLNPNGEPLRFVLPRGDRLYWASTEVNRVKVIIEPFPWFSQALTVLDNIARGIRALLP